MTAPSLGNVGGRASQVADNHPAQGKLGVGPIFLHIPLANEASTYKWVNSDANAAYEVVKAQAIWNLSAQTGGGTLQLRRVRGDTLATSNNISAAMNLTTATNTLNTFTLATAASPDAGSLIGDRVLKAGDRLFFVWSTTPTSLTGTVTIELQPVDATLST